MPQAPGPVHECSSSRTSSCGACSAPASRASRLPLPGTARSRRCRRTDRSTSAVPRPRWHASCRAGTSRCVPSNGERPSSNPYAARIVPSAVASGRVALAGARPPQGRASPSPVAGRVAARVEHAEGGVVGRQHGYGRAVAGAARCPRSSARRAATRSKPCSLTGSFEASFYTDGDRAGDRRGGDDHACEHGQQVPAPPRRQLLHRERTRAPRSGRRGARRSRC